MKVVKIDNENLKTQLLKLGLSEGDVFFVGMKISHGPILLHIGSQEIALGFKELGLIEVSPVHDKLP